MYRFVSIFLVLMLFSCKAKLEAPSKEAIPEAESSEVLSDGHTAQNALDWTGIYIGVLPCADCEGIETTLILKSDLTYLKTEKYLGEEEVFEEEGSFIWMSDGLRIQLLHQNSSNYYKVIENALQALDIEGNEIEGSLSNQYILKKN